MSCYNRVYATCVSNVHFTTLCWKRSKCERLLLSNVIVWRGNPLTLWKKKKTPLPTATMFTVQINDMTSNERNKASTSVCRQTLCRVSRLNMNYPYKLYSWRVTAMTEVAQRQTTDNTIQLLFLTISHKWLWWQKPTRSASHKKTSTSAIDSTSAFGAIHTSCCCPLTSYLHIFIYIYIYMHISFLQHTGRRICFSCCVYAAAAFKPIRDLIIGHYLL